MHQNKEIFSSPLDQTFSTWRTLLHKVPWKPRLESRKKSNGKKQKRAKKSARKRKQKIEICGYIYTPGLDEVKAFDIKSKYLALPFFTLGLKLPTTKHFS
jgi:hypothetical protein